MTLAGRAKPALAAFRLPFAETRRRGSVASFWGELQAPESSATVRIERLVGRAWQPIGTASANSKGVFTFTAPLPPGTRVRAAADTAVGATLIVD